VVSIATSDLEEEASQESAFDPETNTINWDCPCLGGMAHGPCGEEFKTAFSCFVFSEAEPKGIDCVENFKAMQDCFRKHPEHYKDEIEDDDEFENQERSAGGDMAPADSLSTSDDSQRRGEEDEDEGVREFRREMSKES
jgi:intermembrane space import and assembly protein 40